MAKPSPAKKAASVLRRAVASASKKLAPKKAAPAKGAAPAKKITSGKKVGKTAAKKATPVKKAAAPKKTAPKKAVPAKKASKKAAPVKKAGKPAAKKAAPAKKAVKPAAKKVSKPVAKKAVKPVTKKAAPAKKVVKPAAKKATPVKKTSRPAATKAAPVKKATPAKKAVKPAVKKAAPAKSVAKPAQKASPAKATVVVEEISAETVEVVTAPKTRGRSKGPLNPEDIPPPVPLAHQHDIEEVKALPQRDSRPKDKARVKEDDSMWTAAELKSMRAMFTKDLVARESAVAQAQATLEQLISFSDDGAGAETADSGNSTLEREFQISLVEKAQINLEQTQQALARLDAKTYGLCDNCGKPIGKLRLQEANPYATLCIECKELADRGL